MGRRLVLLSLVALAALPAGAGAELPSPATGHRPGPDALYARPAEAPQLENADPWKAAPILVSGAIAYRDGEFLYQDHLYDDRGAVGVRDPDDPFDWGAYLFSPKAGTLTYPTDPVFANNAADLVELRVKPLARATAFRVTLNTLQDASRTAFTIALGDGPVTDWPHGAGLRSPAQRFLTVHGDGATLRQDSGDRSLSPRVDLRRRQIEVRVPHELWNPGTSKVRMTIGVGLWDPAGGGYLRPGNKATATTPGGGHSPSGSGIFNVGPRLDEPLPDVRMLGGGATFADAAVGGALQARWWRERAQAESLQSGDVSRFAADVDFAKLASGARDESLVPKRGPMNRILASRHSFGQGVDYTKACFDIGAGIDTLPKCEGRMVGNLQPYGVYVPHKPKPAKGYGITLLLHSLSANQNQYMGSRNQSQLGERGAGTIVVTPSGRGPDGFYTDIPEADTFEVWADIARHYDLDPGWAVVSGYSMGGYGTYRLAARWPDLFARAFSVVGAPSEPETLPSLRNVPMMAWAATADELVHLHNTEAAQRRMGELGLHYAADLFLAADHLTLATNDQFAPGAEFLGEHRVNRNPRRVTYVVSPGSDSERAGARADHAYWLSGLRLRDPKTAARGTIDARSEAFGKGDPVPSGVSTSPGVLEGGSRGPTPYLHREQTLATPPARRKADRLVVDATNVASATVDARRARLSCSPRIELRSDGPLDLRIACAPARTRCSAPLRIALPRVRGRRIVRVHVLRGKRIIKVARGRNLRRVSVKRPTRKAFALRIRARTSNGRTVTVLRRFRACR